LITFTVSETYAPTILAKRAKKMRIETGEKDHVTEQDLDMRPFSEHFRILLVRPFQLQFGELIVFFVSVYMSVLYGLLYSSASPPHPSYSLTFSSSSPKTNS